MWVYRETCNAKCEEDQGEKKRHHGTRSCPQPWGSCQQALSSRAGAGLDQQGSAHVVVSVGGQVGERVEGGGAVDGGGGKLDRGRGGGGGSIRRRVAIELSVHQRTLGLSSTENNLIKVSHAERLI